MSESSEAPPPKERVIFTRESISEAVSSFIFGWPALKIYEVNGEYSESIKFYVQHRLHPKRDRALRQQAYDEICREYRGRLAVDLKLTGADLMHQVRNAETEYHSPRGDDPMSPGSPYGMSPGAQNVLDEEDESDDLKGLCFACYSADAVNWCGSAKEEHLCTKCMTIFLNGQSKFTCSCYDDIGELPLLCPGMTEVLDGLLKGLNLFERITQLRSGSRPYLEYVIVEHINSKRTKGCGHKQKFYITTKRTRKKFWVIAFVPRQKWQCEGCNKTVPRDQFTEHDPCPDCKHVVAHKTGCNTMKHCIASWCRHCKRIKKSGFKYVPCPGCRKPKKRKQ